MAGDWIKMRLDLQTHPKIVRILSATKSDKFRAIGGLHAVWSVFDTHSTDGTLPGYTPETLDHIIGWQGFSNAMIAVGWLIFDGAETLILPSFDEHNGKSGKRRAEDQRRKRDDRRIPPNVRNESGQIADENRTREEKRREDSKPLVSSAAEDGMLPASTKQDCPHQAIIALYHEKLPQCPSIREWTPTRATQLRARWNENAERQSLEYWGRLFDYVATCDFLVGRSAKPWFADLEWITKSQNFTKIIEGKYENRA